jgi:hypothetical protein
VLRTYLLAALANVVLACYANPVPAFAAPTLGATPGVTTPVPGAATAAPAMLTPPPVVPAPLAIDARYLTAKRTPSGYTLSGQALTKDACQAARFERVVENVFPPAFALKAFRRPGTMGLMCIMRLTWVTVPPLLVASKYPPKWVTVRTQKRAIRVSLK